MLECRHLSYTVQEQGARLGIVDDVSFTLEDGKLLVITGPNGGGKSTLARLIMGILRPTGGSILWNGRDVTPLSVSERARLGVGFAFQQPPRFKGMTVRRLLSLAHGEELPEDVCCGYLTKVGLCSRDYLSRQVDASLSGGELKRIEIATLMARKVGLAIYDEPEAGIDLWSFHMLVESFQNLMRGKGESMVIISHQERIIALADEILVLTGGKVSHWGTKDEVLPALTLTFDRPCGFVPEGEGL